MGRESIVNVCLTLEVLEDNQPNNTPSTFMSLFKTQPSVVNNKLMSLLWLYISKLNRSIISPSSLTRHK